MDKYVRGADQDPGRQRKRRLKIFKEGRKTWDHKGEEDREGGGAKSQDQHRIGQGIPDLAGDLCLPLSEIGQTV